MPLEPPTRTGARADDATGGRRPGLVVMGGSWGGLDAACHVLAEMPSPLPVPVLLVLHRARTSDALVLRQVVRRCSGQGLVEVEDQMSITSGAVHLAPPDYHVLVDRDTWALTTDAPVNYSRPSIDLAFESAADVYAGDVVAVLLSGTGRDGAAGIRRVRDRGGRTLVQAPDSAQRGEMPLAAIRTGGIDTVATPTELGRRLAELLDAGTPVQRPEPQPEARREVQQGTRQRSPKPTGQREGT